MSDKQEAFESFEFDSKPIRGFPELRWAGKRPFNRTQYFPAQKREVYGDSVSGWMNKLFWGDNIQVLSHLLKDFRGGIDFIYLDPPFDSKADYKKKVTLAGKGAANDHSAFEEVQYSDIWTNDNWAPRKIALTAPLG
jgi:adenine specific DNA methylase Mod